MGVMIRIIKNVKLKSIQSGFILTVRSKLHLIEVKLVSRNTVAEKCQSVVVLLYVALQQKCQQLQCYQTRSSSELQ